MAEPVELGIVAEAKSEGRLLRLWEAHGRWCAIVLSPSRGCCGYVSASIDERVDFDEVPAPGGLTWRDEGWVGFDTGHAWDLWLDPEVPEAPHDREMREMGLRPTSDLALIGGDPQVWTIEKMQAAVEALAIIVNVEATHG